MQLVSSEWPVAGRSTRNPSKLSELHYDLSPGVVAATSSAILADYDDLDSEDSTFK